MATALTEAPHLSFHYTGLICSEEVLDLYLIDILLLVLSVSLISSVEIVKQN